MSLEIESLLCYLFIPIGIVKQSALGNSSQALFPALSSELAPGREGGGLGLTHSRARHVCRWDLTHEGNPHGKTRLEIVLKASYLLRSTHRATAGPEQTSSTIGTAHS